MIRLCPIKALFPLQIKLMVPVIVSASLSRYQILKRVFSLHTSYNLECCSQMRTGSFWIFFQLPNTLRGAKKCMFRGSSYVTPSFYLSWPDITNTIHNDWFLLQIDACLFLSAKCLISYKGKKKKKDIHWLLRKYLFSGFAFLELWFMWFFYNN